MMYVVYALIDPRDNTIRYIGITNDVYQRFQDHVSGSGSFVKAAWILELRAANKMVIMETLEEVVGIEMAREREGYWIKHFEMLEEPIMNISKRSSPRRAKRTNLRAGRRFVFELEEVAAEVAAMLVTERKPVLADMESEQHVVSPPQVPMQDTIQAAIKAYHAGARSSRTLALVLGIGKTKASEILKRLRTQGII